MSKERLQLQSEGAAAAAPTGPTMEVCECLVRLANDVRNEVAKRGVTPAELILLRSIHGGAESVTNVVVIGTTPYNSVRERGRLMATYPRYQDRIGQLFSGIAPVFPRTIEEAEQMAQMEYQQAETTMETVAASAPQVPITPLDKGPLS